MIKLSKTTQAPTILSGRSAMHALSLHEQERRDGLAELSDAKSNVYAAKIVREVVYKDQIQKCCYCEKKIERSFNDIEHYRPKKSVKESPSHKGYWWLSYDWDNLLYSCPQCNRSGKNDQFPINDETFRCFKKTDNLALENPYILNPYKDNVEALFEYEFSEKEVKIRPSALDVDERAKKTIEVFKLNREDLKEMRYGEFETFQFVLGLLDELLSSGTADPNQIRTHLEETVLASGKPYVGMLRYYYKLLSDQAA